MDGSQGEFSFDSPVDPSAVRRFLAAHGHPVLDISALTPDALWDPGDVIQLIPAELPTEDLMRVWDALEPAYRLSASYIARVLRVGGRAATDRPVATARTTYEEIRP